MAVFVTESGIEVTDTIGDGIEFVTAAPPIPELLTIILQARCLVQDPFNGGIIYSDVYPSTANEGDIFTQGDGNYWRYDGSAWKPQTVQFPDTFYSNSGADPYVMARRVLLVLMARVNPETWITSFNAGGQSTSFASIADYLAWIKSRLDYLGQIHAQDSDVTGEGYASFESRPIGAY